MKAPVIVVHARYAGLKRCPRCNIKQTPDNSGVRKKPNGKTYLRAYCLKCANKIKKKYLKKK